MSSTVPAKKYKLSMSKGFKILSFFLAVQAGIFWFSVDVRASNCSGAYPESASTTSTSGTFRVFAVGVSGASYIYFPTWSDSGGQDDIVWYPGIHDGGGDWHANINLGSHPGYGAINVHVYMNNPWPNFCGNANFTRTQPIVTVSLSANPVSVAYNSSSTLTWTSSNAEYCVLYVNGQDTGHRGLSNSVSTGNLTQSNTYKIDCINSAGGFASNSVTVNVEAPPQPPPNQKPVGYLDVADCSIIGGWAFDPNTPSDSISVHIYDGGAGPGKLITSVTADGSRPDVNSAYGISGNHGFTINTPSNLKDGKSHSIYAYGIDSSGDPNFSSDLSNSPQTLSCKLPVGDVVIKTNRQSAEHYTSGPGDWGTQTKRGDYIWSDVPTGIYSVVAEQISRYNVFVSPQGGNLSTGQTLNFSINYSLKAPAASITCNGSSSTAVPYGGSAEVKWSSTDAQSCTVSPTGWTGTSGSRSTGPLYSTQTYSLTCTN